MKDHQIEERLRSIMESAPIDLLDEIKKKPVVKMLRHDEITRQAKRPSLILKSLPLVSAALLMLLFGTWYREYQVVDSEIYLDVNPSIELKTNRRNEVIEIVSSNEDGVQILKGLNYKGKTYEEVTKEILNQMILDGYLRQKEEILLLSVFSKDQKNEEKKLTRMDGLIHEYLLDRGITPILLGQKMDKTDVIENYAKEYGVSASKMTFIRNLMILHENLKLEELIPLSLEELLTMSRNLKLDLGRIIESEDFEEWEEREEEPGEGEIEQRLTLDEARTIALSKALGQVLDEDEDDDSYEFEIQVGDMIHELEIDAYTGIIVKHELDTIDDDGNENEENDDR